MNDKIDKLIEAMNYAKFFHDDEEYAIFDEAFKELRNIPKYMIEQPLIVIKKLFKIFNDETEDFQTQMEVWFYIQEFHWDKIISSEDLTRTCFEEFEEMLADKMAWVEDFVSTLTNKDFLPSIKTYLPNAHEKVKNAFRNEALSNINDNKATKEDLLTSKEILILLDSL